MSTSTPSADRRRALPAADRIRRNRRVGTTIGGVAAAGILAVGLAVALPGDDPAPPRPRSRTTRAIRRPSTDDGPPVQIDGRSTVAALRAAVLEVADGDTTAYAGQSGYPSAKPNAA